MKAGTGQIEPAIESFRRGITLGANFPTTAADGPEYRNDLAWNCNNLGGLLVRSGQFAAGRRFMQRGIDTWEPLVNQHSRPEFRYGLGTAYKNLGWLKFFAGQVSEALEDTRRGVALNEAAIVEDLAELRFKDSLSMCLDNLGFLYDIDGQSENAQKAYERALAGRRAPGPREPCRE